MMRGQPQPQLQNFYTFTLSQTQQPPQPLWQSPYVHNRNHNNHHNHNHIHSTSHTHWTFFSKISVVTVFSFTAAIVLVLESLPDDRTALVGTRSTTMHPDLVAIVICIDDRTSFYQSSYTIQFVVRLQYFTQRSAWLTQEGSRWRNQNDGEDAQLKERQKTIHFCCRRCY